MTAPEPHPGAPRWVKVFGFVAAVLLVIGLVLMLTGGDHGPGRHVDGGHAPPAGAGRGAPHP